MWVLKLIILLLLLLLLQAHNFSRQFVQTPKDKLIISDKELVRHAHIIQWTLKDSLVEATNNTIWSQHAIIIRHFKKSGIELNERCKITNHHTLLSVVSEETKQTAREAVTS